MTTSPTLRPLTREEVRGIDRRAIDEFGLSGLVLMENAGRNAAMIIADQFADNDAGTSQHVGIVCGKGNNAGDGFVIARHLEITGFEPLILLIEDAETLSADANANYQIAVRSGLTVRQIDTGDQNSEFANALCDCDLVIDALVGTGLRGSARGRIASAIQCINHSRGANKNQRVVSIDIPSGMDCDLGTVGAGEGPGGSNCVRADLTITFVAAKVGFRNATAKKWLGDLQIAGIGAPMALLQDFRIE